MSEPYDGPILEINNLSISFFTRLFEIPAVMDFSCTVMPGEAMGLVGESGCGKSTVALGVMQDLGVNGKCVSGSIKFKGRELTTMSDAELRELRGSEIAMIYQEPMASLNPAMKIGKQLMEVPMIHEGSSKQEAYEMALDVVESVRLPDPARIMNSFPHQLSGGQQQRIVIAMALMSKPSLLILDEPTNHLDIESREALVFALAAYEGAVILVSHDPHLVNAVADTLWLVKDGQVGVFTEDLEAYKKLLLSERGVADRAEKPKKVKKKRLSHGEQRKILAPFKAEVAKCEERVAKILEIKEKIDEALADPDIYTHSDPNRFESLSKKRAEAEDAVQKAESLWMKAEEDLEKARAEL